MRFTKVFLTLLLCAGNLLMAQTQPDVTQIKSLSPVPIEKYGAGPGYGNLRTAILAAKTAGVAGVKLQSGVYSFSGGAISLGTGFLIKSEPGTTITCVGSVFRDTSAVGCVDNTIIDGGKWVGDSASGSTFLYVLSTNPNLGLSGFQLKNCTITGFDYGCYLPQAFAGQIENCKINNNRVGVYARQAYDFGVFGGAMSGNASCGLDIGGTAITILNCDMSHNDIGISIATTTAITIVDGYFELNPTACIKYDGTVYNSTIMGCLIQTPATSSIGIDTNNGHIDTAISVANCFFDGVGIPIKGDATNVDELTLINTSYASGIGASLPGRSDFLVFGRSGMSLTTGATHLVSFNRYLGESGEKSLVNILETGIDVVDLTIASGGIAAVKPLASFTGWIEVLATGSVGMYYVDAYSNPSAPIGEILDSSSTNFSFTPFGGTLTETPSTIVLTPAGGQIILKNNYTTPMRVLCRTSKKRL